MKKYSKKNGPAKMPFYPSHCREDQMIMSPTRKTRQGPQYLRMEPLAGSCGAISTAATEEMPKHVGERSAMK